MFHSFTIQAVTGSSFELQYDSYCYEPVAELKYCIYLYTLYGTCNFETSTSAPPLPPSPPYSPPPPASPPPPPCLSPDSSCRSSEQCYSKECNRPDDVEEEVCI